MVLEYGEMYKQIGAKKNIEYLESAEECLRLIQLKKIHDLKRQWAANLIKIDEIEVEWDFLPYISDPLNCNFVEPANSHEIELFTLYLQKDTTEYMELPFETDVDMMGETYPDDELP